MGVVVKHFDVFLVNLDPTIGSEIQKTRPCVIVSPDEMNRHIARRLEVAHAIPRDPINLIVRFSFPRESYPHTTNRPPGPSN